MEKRMTRRMLRDLQHELNIIVNNFAIELKIKLQFNQLI